MDQGETLLSLQETDLETIRTQKRLDELPVKQSILAIRQKTRDVQVLKTKTGDLVAGFARAMSRNEDETAQITDKLETEQEKVMSGEITNPKEIQHLTREMDALRRRKEKLEMEDLDLMERAEKAAGQVAKVDAALEQLATQEASLTAQFRTEGGELQTELEELAKSRTVLASRLDGELLGRYEALRTAKGGVGAALLKGHMCSACRMELPAQRIEELLAGPEIAVCPVCKRLLVIKPVEDES